MQRNKPFESFFDRCRSASEILCSGFAASGTDLDICYRESIKVVLQALAGLMLWGKRHEYPINTASVSEQSFYTRRNPDPPIQELNLQGLLSWAKGSGISIFDLQPELPIMQSELENAFRALLQPLDSDLPELPNLLFTTITLDWLGTIYEKMLALTPVRTKDSTILIAGKGDIYLTADALGRKRRGAYFTPDFLVNYTVERALQPLLDDGIDPLDVTVLDPSMGKGDFLLGSVNFLSKHTEKSTSEICREKIRRGTLCGVDNDPMCVHIARFGLAITHNLSVADVEALNKSVVCEDSLDLDINGWQRLFPLRLPSGFDAVIGNPPYVSAKSSLTKAPEGDKNGQHDLYLRFLKAVIDNNLVRAEGALAMVLPDPFLIRGNGREIRRQLFGGWETLSVLHIASAFQGAGVANAIPIWRNREKSAGEFTVYRIESSNERRQFQSKGEPSKNTELVVPADIVRSRPGAELIYLLADERYRRIVETVQKPDGGLKPGFAQLSTFAEHIFRGEEIGKRAISQENGRFKMLMGGQSVKPYRIVWEGRWAERLQKREEYYLGPKILLQKSAPRLIAALDTENHVFPQSVYSIRLRPGHLDPYFLLALLNSQFLNNFLFATSTGYKLLQPQIEIHHLHELPIPNIHGSTPADERKKLAQKALEKPEAAARLVTAPDVARDVLIELSKRLCAIATDDLPSQETVVLRKAIDTVVEHLYLSSGEQTQLSLF